MSAFRSGLAGVAVWVPASIESPPQLCLITASMDTFDADRIRVALSLLADDLVLPAFAYLPLAFGTKEIGTRAVARADVL